MTAMVLVIGGYGTFGTFIATALSQDPNIEVIIAGRSPEKAEKLATELGCTFTAIDIHQGFDDSLEKIRPDIVIHTSGPYQGQDYAVAKSCIRQGCHYIDLADARAFVAGIGELNAAARAANVLVVSGASSVPCLTAAVIDHYRSEFQKLLSVDYGIATAQKTGRGLATTQSVLSYAGKPFRTLINGVISTVYGWQSLHLHKFPGLGWRFLGNCDVPDLELFPKRYPDLKTIRFYAGLGLPFIHLCLWTLTWPVRLGFISSLVPLAPFMLRIAGLFDRIGGDKSAFYMRMRGTGADSREKSLTFNLTAHKEFGPFIPCMPAILITRQLAAGTLETRGATPCVDLIDLETYLNALDLYPVTSSVSL
jgi:saccharopine dehydrogenase-like NADP-dependent oxidoreductase